MQENIEISLTKAVPEDLDELYAVCHAAALESPTTGWGEEYPNRDILSRDISKDTLYKILHDGKIISIMQISPWSQSSKNNGQDSYWDPAIKNPCYFGRFCIAVPFQGKGLGRKVMLASIEKAKSMGFDGVYFHAAKSDTIATHIYDSIGFRRACEGHVHGMDFVAYDMQFQESQSI